MKHLYSLLLSLMAIFIFSCQKDEINNNRKTGSLHIDVGLFISVNEFNSPLKSTQQTEDFKVIIYRSDASALLRRTAD